MSKTTNVTVTVAMDEEQLNTLLVYLSQNEKTLDSILHDTVNETLNKLYTKNVPQAVQNFLSLKNGAPISKADKPKPEKKPRENKGKSRGGQALVIDEIKSKSQAIS